MSNSDLELQQLLQDQEAAWNAGDGLAWASVFTDDADYVNILGDVFPGREEIARQYVFILGGPYKGSHLRIRIRKITEPSSKQNTISQASTSLLPVSRRPLQEFLSHV
jgi:uncharacterized protein (TIGR02246 family)